MGRMTRKDLAARRWRRRGVGAGLVLALAGAPGAVACSQGSDGAACAPTEGIDHQNDTLVIEGDPWSGYAPFRDPHLLDDTPYRPMYVEQLCQEQRAADLTYGVADFAVTTLDQYVLHQPEATVVGVIDQSLGADALVLDTSRYPYLDSVDDLHRLVAEYNGPGDGPVLAYTGSSPSEMLLNELANTTEELDLSDFELVTVDQSATAYQMLQSGEAQLAVVWEPDTTAARDAGFTVALSSADVPDSIVDVILASNRLIEADPDAVEAVVDAYYTTMDDFLAHRDALIEAIAEDSGGVLDEAAAASVVDGIKLYGTNDANVFMNEPVFPLDQPQATASLQSIGSVLALVHPDIRLSRAAIDGSYIADIAVARYGTGGGAGGDPPADTAESTGGGDQ
jgi:OmpA-OmpF porin, OOP family